MRVIEVTLGAGATQLTTDQSLYASFMLVSASTAVATLGDNTVSSSKGIPLGIGTPLALTFSQPRGSRLSDYWLVGTANDKVEVLYETAQ
jgi:hypothetical protein